MIYIRLVKHVSLAPGAGFRVGKETFARVFQHTGLHASISAGPHPECPGIVVQNSGVYSVVVVGGGGNYSRMVRPAINIFGHVL